MTTVPQTGGAPLPLAQVMVIGAVCLGVAGFFSGTETGVMSVSRARVRRMLRAGHAGRSGRLLEKMLDSVEDTILSCLIGTNLFNVVFSALVTMAVTVRLGPEREWLAVVMVSVLVILFSEILPKVMYREFPERLMLASAMPLATAKFLLWPVRKLLGLYSAAWRGVLGAGHQDGGFDRRSLAALLLSYTVPGGHEERFTRLVDRFLKLAGRNLTDMAKPLDELVTVTPRTTVGACLEMAARSGFSRLPVFGSGPEGPLGYVLVRDLLFLPPEDHAHPVPRPLWRDILLVDARMSPYELFEELRTQQDQLAMVTDPDGHARGMITLEDLIETVVGSINDEFDPVNETKEAS